jgi:hypothetical protein
LESPYRQSDLFSVTREGHVLDVLEASSRLVFSDDTRALPANDLRDIDELGERRLQILGDEELQFFCCEGAKGA